MKIPKDVQTRIAIILAGHDTATLGELLQHRSAVGDDHAYLLDLQARIAAAIVPSKPRESRDVEYNRVAARQDLTLLNHGVTRTDGVTHPELTGLIGHPGFSQVQRWMVRLDTLIEQARQREAAQADGPVLRPFRYTGRAGRHDAGDGHYLEPGDVVELTEAQATNFADRFEPVAAEPVAEEVTG